MITSLLHKETVWSTCLSKTCTESLFSVNIMYRCFFIHLLFITYTSIKLHKTNGWKCTTVRVLSVYAAPSVRWWRWYFICQETGQVSWRWSVHEEFSKTLLGGQSYQCLCVLISRPEDKAAACEPLQNKKRQQACAKQRKLAGGRWRLGDVRLCWWRCHNQEPEQQITLLSMIYLIKFLGWYLLVWAVWFTWWWGRLE